MPLSFEIEAFVNGPTHGSCKLGFGFCVPFISPQDVHVRTHPDPDGAAVHPVQELR